VVYDEIYGEVLWIHIIGPLATEILSEAAAVLHLEGTVDDMMNMMHAHPTVWEGMGDAFASVRGLQINVWFGSWRGDRKHLMKICHIVDLGLVGYADAWELQKRVVSARKAGLVENVLLLCEHPHVITLGRNGKRENLLASEQVLRQKNVEFHASDRGGDITYHGPGQIVGYPILNLGAIRKDVGWYVRALEEVMIRASAEFAITAERVAGRTGIWVGKPDAGNNQEEKLGAIGVHLSRWVTSHGLAYNVATDLRYFDLIVPCGITGRKATSLEKLLNRAVKRQEAIPPLVQNFAEVFEFEMRQMSAPELLEQLHAAEKHLFPASFENNLEPSPTVEALSSQPI
jgi:lipoyl(octanoyl) transferase